MKPTNKPGLYLVPCTIQDAKECVRQWHRHNAPPNSALFAVAVAHTEDDKIRGVCIIGRPKASKTQDGWTAEVVRVATDGTRNACSMLYGAAWRACRALGYKRLHTFTLKTEPGTSLRGAGFNLVGETPGRSWSTKNRPRVDKHPLQERLKWERTA